MKAKTLKTFKDTQAGVVHHAGDVFECSRDRFSEIDAKLKGYVQAVDAERTEQPTLKNKFRK